MRTSRTTLTLALAILPIVACAVEVSAKSAIIIDAGTGKVLWEKDADTPRYPASTTKIMTGMLLLEHCLPSDIITAPVDVEKVKEASMHLKPFEKVSAKDMLYALMLRSANDGCYAVAHHIAGSVEGFAKLMNERARQIGCKNTHFNNPNGLNDPLHTTTARDLALIAREAMKYEPFREVVRTQKYEIARTINVKDRVMVNRNKWLAKDPTADGIKTGYTRPAGLCYVGSATRNGFRVITAILKSENWQQDHKAMLAWAFKHYEKKETIRVGDVVGEARLVGGAEELVPVVAKAPSYVVARKGTVVERRIETTALEAPIQEGQQVGELVLRDSEGFEQRIPVVAQRAVPMATLAALRKSAGTNGWAVVLGSLLFVGAYVVRGRSRKLIDGTTS